MVWFGLLAVLALQGIPPGWTPVGRPVTSAPDLTWDPQYVWRVDTAGRFLYTRGRRYDFKEGSSRAFDIYEGAPGKNYPPRYWLAWSDQVNNDWDEYGFDDVFYASDGLLGVHVSASIISNVHESLVASRIGDPPRLRSSPLPRGMESEVTFEDNFGKVPPNVLQEGFYIRRGSRQVRVREPAVWGSGNKTLADANVTNGVDWSRGIAYLQTDSKEQPALLCVRFGGKHLTSELLRVRSFDVSNTFWHFTVLADGSLIGTGRVFAMKRGPRWMHRKWASIRYDPLTQKWTQYDGLAVIGSSTDGRYVAYTEEPWTSLHLAQVRPARE